MEEFIKKVKNYVEKNEKYLINEVRSLLQIPSISGTGEGIKETVSYLTKWIKDKLNGEVNLFNYFKNPIIYAKIKGKNSKKVIFYNMYDVQPVEPLESWESPPFEARIVGDKIIARGAYNTKGALMSCLLGILSYFELENELPFNILLVLEGEEELGSPSMPKFIEEKYEELKDSIMCYFAFPSERIIGKPMIVLGNKGIVFLEIKSKISKYDIHSSFSRGFINPVAVISSLISHLIDPIEGPKIPWLEEKAISPTDEDLQYLNDIKEASPLEEIMEMYGIKYSRIKGDEWYLSVYFKPTVNVDGIYSGYVGLGTKTIIPSEAIARLDFRLVPAIEPKDVIEGLNKIIERLGYKDLVEVKIHDAYTWSKTNPKEKVVEISKEVYKEMGLKPYIIPILPGSAPSYLFTRVLKIPMIATAPGHGGRAHAPNEYITLDTIPKIVMYTSILIKKLSTFQ
jgi:Acetylornithine deacetylase/Succinyl-diaminopimelate desuccinylase and related deacylases